MIPTAGQTATRRRPTWSTSCATDSSDLEKKYGVTDMLVTGPTAINIDVSDRLAGALLPFAAIVIGLSLLLLMIVFRSVAVPLKATLGYLLSVGAALGAVVVVFQWGWLDGLLPGLADGPIVSFLPIFVMGVLFGLAMDYEMFLVSAMREEYVRVRGRARRRATAASGVLRAVVTAAALIMTVGVRRVHPGRLQHHQADRVRPGRRRLRRRLPGADDAGAGGADAARARAWWLPAWLDARIPSVVDVEGAAMHRKIDYEDWEETHGTAALVARDLVRPRRRHAGPPGGAAHPGDPSSPSPRTSTPSSWPWCSWVGRSRTAESSSSAACCCPSRVARCTSAAAYVEVGRPGDDGSPCPRQVHDRARLTTSVPAPPRRVRGARHGAGRATCCVRPRPSTVTPGRWDGAPSGPRSVEAALAVAGGARLLVLIEEGPESNVPAGTAEALAQKLSREGITAVLVRPEAWRRQRMDAPRPGPRGSAVTEEASS